jgi:nitroreductase
VLRAIFEAAIRAPTGGNSQGWSFVAVQDAALRRELGAMWKQLAEELIFAPDGRYTRLLESADPVIAGQTKRMLDSVRYLAEHLHEAPVIVLACLNTGGNPTEIASGASIYPAVQNLMLAARAFGIGSTLTTIHRRRQDDVRALLGIPAEVETAALIPLGYPRGRWGMAQRRPLDQVVFRNRWGGSFA